MDDGRRDTRDLLVSALRVKPDLHEGESLLNSRMVRNGLRSRWHSSEKQAYDQGEPYRCFPHKNHLSRDIPDIENDQMQAVNL
jgi:hypothetical protein